jgi:hypothetical protein
MRFRTDESGLAERGITFGCCSYQSRIRMRFRMSSRGQALGSEASTFGRRQSTPISRGGDRPKKSCHAAHFFLASLFGTLLPSQAGARDVVIFAEPPLSPL